MTPKQERFVQEYMVDLNATQAAIRAGLTLSKEPPKSGFYVYLILCPETGRILYVGKGKKRRMLAHVSEAKRGIISSTKKYLLLREHLESGAEPVAVVFQAGLLEQVALGLERDLIAFVGIENLGNSKPGATTLAERQLAEARALQRRLLPFDVWRAKAAPSPFNLRVRRFVDEQVQHLINYLTKCVEHGVRDPYEIIVTERDGEITIEPTFLDPRYKSVGG